MDEVQLTSAFERWPREGEWTFASHFATWDSAHYLRLSELGYAKDVRSCAFYPLWPLLMRWSAPGFGGSHLVAGLVLSNVLSLAGWLVFYRLTAARFGAAVAGWALALLVAYPGSLFYQFLYSESLFFLLVMGLWWGLERRRLPVALAAALLLPLTRAIGVFAVLPIAWFLLASWKAEGRRQKEGKRMEDGGLKIAEGPAAPSHAVGEMADGLQTPSHAGKATSILHPLSSILSLRRFLSRRWLLLLLAPVAGWGIYLALMWHWTGNPWEGFAAQKHWGRHSVWHLVDVPKFVAGYFDVQAVHEWPSSLVDRIAFVLLLYMIPTIWRLGKDMMVWTYVLGVIPAMSGTFTSYVRYHSCVFPFFIALAVWLLARRAAWPRWAVLGIFAAGHAVLVWRFVNFRWAG
jgi:hypothetical protein